jgi:thioredoxin-like negative regulator of GroEL
VEEIWAYTARDLENHGVGTGRINKNVDPQLARLLGVRKLPDFVAVINGKLYHYSGSISGENLKNFVSGLFSTCHLIPEVCNYLC